MSHLQIRKEKDCLNCGTEVQGRYCHICGQENIEPKETVWHLFLHLIYDIIHFDSKFFNTVKYLLLKPGYLSIEYNKGRRASYLNPIKMYVFISAFFFIFLLSVINPLINKTTVLNEIAKPSEKEAINNSTLTDTINTKNRQSNTTQIAVDTIAKPNKRNVNVKYTYGQNYKTYQEYDSAQEKLPENKQDGWIRRKMTAKSIHFKQKYGNNVGSLLHDLSEKFVHYFPQMFFASLPIFALLLLILYKSRKDIYYVNHAIYTLHLYCALFIFMFLILGLGRLEKVAFLGWLKYLSWILQLYIVWYLFASLKSFYGQKYLKTFFKMILLLAMQTFVLLALFVLFLGISVFSL